VGYVSQKVKLKNHSLLQLSIKWIVLTVIGVADILLKMGSRFPVSKKSQLKKYLPHSNH
jgi:hypothetical protein